MPNKLDKMNQPNSCPVCGYYPLEPPAYDSFGLASFEICPCCATQFGYDDAEPVELRFSKWVALRERWIDEGMLWHHPSWGPPKNWNPVDQLKRAGLS